MSDNPGFVWIVNGEVVRDDEGGGLGAGKLALDDLDEETRRKLAEDWWTDEEEPAKDAEKPDPLPRLLMDALRRRRK
jgi:hypothetical protein